MKVAQSVIHSIIALSVLSMLILLAGAAPAHAAGTTITVNSFLDDTLTNLNLNATCDLREAVEAVNTGASFNQCTGGSAPYTIAFDIGTGVQTITLSSALIVSAPVAIDGTTQNGFSGIPLIDLDGGGTVNPLLRFFAGSTGSIARSLMFTNVGGSTALTLNDSGITVAGNYFNTDGSSVEGNVAIGLGISSSNDTVGGTNTSDRNLFAGAAGIYQNAGTGALIENNYFGLKADGATAITGQTTSDDAIFIYTGSATSDTIRGNVITGFGYGIELDPGVSTTTIAANKIGVTADGSTAVGNSSSDIFLDRASSNTIGGPLAADGNIFATTGGTAVNLHNNAAGSITGNLIQNNYFGVQPSGNTGISGQSTGAEAIILDPGSGTLSSNTIRHNLITVFHNAVDLREGSQQNTIAGNIIGLGADGSTALGGSGDAIPLSGAVSNTIGGPTAADRNIISNYVGAGIALTDGVSLHSDSNTIQGNYIGTDAAGSVAKPNYEGIFVLDGDSNLITGNLVSGNTDAGIFAENGATNTQIFDNRVGTNAAGSSAIPNVQNGIRIMDHSAVIGSSTIPGNNLISGNGNGILIQNGSGTTVFKNKIGTNLFGNGVLPNTSEGIYVGSASAQIANNWIAYNSDGVFVDGSGTVATGSSHNCFKGNTNDGVESINTGLTAPFTGNWWNSSTGPSGLGPGTGDAVSANVGFSPFLSTAVPIVCAPGPQLLKNPSFEIDANNDSKPDSWAFTNFKTTNDKRDCTIHKTGKCSLKLAGTSKQKVASQTISKSGVAGDDINFSLWSRAGSIPVGSVYRLQVIFYHGGSIISTQTMNFTAGSHTFKKVSGTFTTPGPYNKIVFKIVFKASSGTAWFDTAALNFAP